MAATPVTAPPPSSRAAHGAGAAAVGGSERVAAARAAAEDRQDRRGRQLRSTTVALLLVVAASAADARPGLGLSGRALALTAVLAAWALALGYLSWQRARRPRAALVLATLLSLAILALQQTGQSSIAAAASTFMVVSFLPGRAATAAGVLVTAAVGAIVLVREGSAGGAVSTMLLCAILGVAGFFVRRSGEQQLETELLLAELQDAREAQTQAAAAEERRRIAAELHDVLAHALSGAAIQLEGARALAAREDASPRLTATVGRAGELVRAGLVDARRAVEALRGDPLPGLAELPALVATVRADLRLDVALTIDRATPPLGPEAGLALYRGVQEALTNAHRHAPGASVTVEVAPTAPPREGQQAQDRHRRGSSAPVAPVEATATGVQATVISGPATRTAAPSPGGGHGLDGLDERVTRVGGTVDAGPTPDGGWRVRVEVPA